MPPKTRVNNHGTKNELVQVRVRADVYDALRLYVKSHPEHSSSSGEAVIDILLREKLAPFIEAAAKIRAVEDEVLTHIVG